MEEKILIQNLKMYPYTTMAQAEALMAELEKADCREMLVFPDPEHPNGHLFAVLEKYHTPALTDSCTVRNSAVHGPFRLFTLSRGAFLPYLSYLRKQMDPNYKPSTFQDLSEKGNPLDAFLSEESAPPPPPKADPILTFLQNNTPVKIQQALDRHVIGQPELTHAVADFLYYHALRQKHPQLPPRPLMITGPSGSGKTEVWRVAGKLYRDVFQIQIIDGSNLSCDGWSGNYKLSTFVTAKLAQGGILVVDEFDKLVTPKFASGGDNVALQMQSEFLKLLEGEHHVTENKRQTDITSKMMGFVLVGAFEQLRDRKNHAKESRSIGFCSQATTPAVSADFTDEDFISYGIMPEIVGRIAVKCVSRPLDEQAYMDIIRGSYSRVAVIEGVLRQYGIQVDDVISREELRALIQKSKTNRTGVRWVSAQVENRLLEAIREQGLFPCPPQAAA